MPKMRAAFFITFLCAAIHICMAENPISISDIDREQVDNAYIIFFVLITAITVASFVGFVGYGIHVEPTW